MLFILNHVHFQFYKFACYDGLIITFLGTLGRQGNPAILNKLKAMLDGAGKSYVTLLMSEIFPERLALMKDVKAWVQVI